MTTAQQLPNNGAYAKAWRTLKTMPAGAMVKHPSWVRGAVTAAEMLLEMRVALDRRINSRGGDELANEPMPIELQRDYRRVQEIVGRRIRHYKFETAKVNGRFGHLLASRHD